MSLSDYMEKVDDGETVYLTQMYQDGDYEAVVEAWEYGNRNGPNLEIDSNDAYEIMNDNFFDPDNILENVRDVVEEGVASIYGKAFDGGYNKAASQIQSWENNSVLSDDDVRDKSLDQQSKKETTKKVTEAGMAAGTTGTMLGAGIGSIHITGGSLALGVGSGAVNAKAQGKQEKYIKQAAKGLESAYGGLQLDIN